ncbi:RNA-guided endonuclease TnpB family protein [Natrinema versiforme]|uniref:IS200/IS605 family element transposase accessory protein TnpB n=1 Tax=Natrinema versiforme TaxID=88724 RepID=A0A4P8WG22_9EURY|nr:RNA-guided endonuclease TnpB family protein [Natrinema versiforme]QCS42024.1 IS200/IS605 family element transposase accessory protein TnpB [Natrinema versiforme]
MASNYLTRTAITRLRVSPTDARLLEKTSRAWREGCQLAADIGWRNDICGKRRLQSLAYDRIREDTGLGSMHATLAIHHAADALSAVATLEEHDQSVSKPEFTSPTIRYEPKTLSLFDDQTVSLTTVEQRVRCELVLPSDDEGYQWQFIEADAWEIGASTLVTRNDSYFLHLGFRRPRPSVEEREPKRVLGVDLGIENLAVTSTARFESGREFAHRQRQFEAVRSGLQKTGTQSAHRTLAAISGREARSHQQSLHEVANAILEETEEYDCSHIVFENLRHIQNRISADRTFHQWAHRTLVEFVEYRAEEAGIEVVFVDPAYTSQRCCECGHESRENRVSRDHFACEECGMEAHADYNAAKNIGWKFLRCGPQSSQRTGHGQLALKSGTVTPNRGFIPYSDSEAEAENIDKSGSESDS